MNEEEWLQSADYSREKPDEKMRREYVKQICDAIYHFDFSALDELLRELNTDLDMKLGVWNGLNSRERRFIKNLEKE